VSVAGATMVPASPLTRAAAKFTLAVILGSTVFLVSNYATLPDLLPVHFGRSGSPNGWQYKTLPRVLMPVFVQLALALTLGGIGALLLSRQHGEQDADAPDVKAASTAAEAVIVITTIWVLFQGYAAYALVNMWTVSHGALGQWYYNLELFGIVLTGIVCARAHKLLGRPAPRPFVAEHWRFGQLYRNPDDPALFVPTRHGARWTLNFGRPVAAALLGAILAIGILGPTIILALALR
jgi:uncharacterized membrane protein